MDSTVQPDRKETLATSIIPSASSTGLMITPPPIPQTLPIADAKKHTSAMIHIATAFPSFYTERLLFLFASSIPDRDGDAISDYVIRMDFSVF